MGSTEEAGRFAWLAYNSADFDLARRWLERAGADPLGGRRGPPPLVPAGLQRGVVES